MKTRITGTIKTDLIRFDNPDNTFYRNKISVKKESGEEVAVNCYYNPKTEEETEQLLENMKIGEQITLFGNLTQSRHLYNNKWYDLYTMTVINIIS